jgi:hypothetical protein
VVKDNYTNLKEDFEEIQSECNLLRTQKLAVETLLNITTTEREKTEAELRYDFPLFFINTQNKFFFSFFFN